MSYKPQEKNREQHEQAADCFGGTSTKHHRSGESIRRAEPERRHADWQGLKTLIRIQREQRINDQLSTETAYFISSRTASADFFLDAVRGHWAIENRLHWSLDVTFREDHNQTRNGFATENLALIRRLALVLLKRETSVKVGLQAKRLRAGWHNDYLLKVLNC